MSTREYSLAPFVENVKSTLPTVSDHESLQKGLGLCNVMKGFVPDFPPHVRTTHQELQGLRKVHDW